MKSEEEEEEKKEGNLGQKLRRGLLLGKKRVPSTPVILWRDTLFSYSTPPAHFSIHRRHFSSRKLAAALWEFNHLHREKGLGLSSSLEDQEAPYNPVFTPTGSLDFKRRIRDSHYSLRTSRELLKVLNHICSLEEQHASDASLIRTLKNELDHARVKIKDLSTQDHHEMDGSMEQDRIHDVVQSLRDELEGERKLRKRSESIRKKLARDLSEVKSSLASARKELERERKSRKLLEDLCDEFAKGIKDYDQELRALKKRFGTDWHEEAEEDCNLILHVSESWLDERTQMKFEEAQHGFAENHSIVDKFSFKIETFLRSTQMGTSESRGKEATDDPIDVKTDHTKKNFAPRERVKSRDPSSLQVKFEEQMARAMDKKSEKGKKTEDLSCDRTYKHDQIHGSCSNVHAENDFREASCSEAAWRSHASPVRHWLPRNPTPDVPESASRLHPVSKANTLKTKLLEARLKEQRSRSKDFKMRD